MLNTTSITSGVVAVESDAPAIAGATIAPLALPAPSPAFPIIDGVFAVVQTSAPLALPAPAAPVEPAPVEPATPDRPFAAKAAKLAAKRNAAKPSDPAVDRAKARQQKAGRITAEQIQAKHDHEAAVKAGRRAKPAAPPAASAKPAPAAPPAAPVKPSDTDRAKARESLAAARALASAAVLAFYDGSSAPFKAAGVKLRPLNGGSRVCGISKRQSALLLTLATYGANAFRPDGSFQRDAFRVPARLLNPSAPVDVFVSAQPESGCVADGRGERFHYSGEAAYSASTIVRIDYAGARACILATHGQKLADAFRDMLASYGVIDAIRADSVIGTAKPKAAAKAA